MIFTCEFYLICSENGTPAALCGDTSIEPMSVWHGNSKQAKVDYMITYYQ